MDLAIISYYILTRRPTVNGPIRELQFSSFVQRFHPSLLIIFWYSSKQLPQHHYFYVNIAEAYEKKIDV
jgi:hypothetical protein